MLAGMYRGPGKQIVAWNSALLYDMIYTQPVVYELGELQMPTLLMIGDKDTTAIGKDAAPPEVRAKLGHYPELGQRRGADDSACDAGRIRGHGPRAADAGPAGVSQGAARRVGGAAGQSVTTMAAARFDQCCGLITFR